MPYRMLADAVLALHVAIAAFVVLGLIVVVAGNLRGWAWVNELWFRLAHLAAQPMPAASSSIGCSTCSTTTHRLGCSRSGIRCSRWPCSPLGGCFPLGASFDGQTQPTHPNTAPAPSSHSRWILVRQTTMADAMARSQIGQLRVT